MCHGSRFHGLGSPPELTVRPRGARCFDFLNSFLSLSVYVYTLISRRVEWDLAVFSLFLRQRKWIAHVGIEEPHLNFFVFDSGGATICRETAWSGHHVTAL